MSSSRNFLSKLARLWQPRHPAFWTMLALNGATSVLVWVSQTMPLAVPARLVILGFAVGNLWMGLRCAKTLMDSPGPDDQSDR